jgi:hypothetical protein
VSGPLVIGPLRAYRCWQVKWQGDQPELRSVYYSTVWPAGTPLRATCERRPSSLAEWIRGLFSRRAERPTHPAPSWGCQCGVYGFARLDMDELERSPQVAGRDPDRGVTALGVVLLWGRVIQHELGYRAEYARPLTLLRLPPELHTQRSGELLDAVASRYAVPLVSRVTELG